MLQNDYNISVAYCTNIFNIGGGHIIAMLFLLLLQLLAEYKSAGRRVYKCMTIEDLCRIVFA